MVLLAAHFADGYTAKAFLSISNSSSYSAISSVGFCEPVSIWRLTMFDPYHKWLGIPPKDRPPNHYRLLSLELYESDLDVIEGAADRVMAFIRQYQSGEQAAAAAKLLNEIATARLSLLKPASKSEYDAKLRKQLAVTQVRQDEIPLVSLNLQHETAALPPIPKRTPAAKRKKSKKRNSPLQPGIAVGVIFVAAVLLFAFSMKSGEKPPEVTSEAKGTLPAAQTEAPQPKPVTLPMTEQTNAKSTGATIKPEAELPPVETGSNAEIPQISEKPAVDSAAPQAQATLPEAGTSPDHHKATEIVSLVNVELRNHSFETKLEPTWKVETYMSRSDQVKIVETLAKSGRKSLLLRAVKPDDVRCLQQVNVKSNTRYRFSGWVRTSKVAITQKGGPQGANLSVTDIGNSPSLIGDNDWTELNFEFDTGPRKQIELGPRLGCFGSVCVGMAWFDDIRLFEITTRLE